MPSALDTDALSVGGWSSQLDDEWESGHFSNQEVNTMDSEAEVVLKHKMQVQGEVD